jgi:hypothetical protein
MTKGFAGLALALAAMPLAAHHSMRGEYDLSKVITIQGVVTKREWMNPHARFYLEVTDAIGSAVIWELELGSPNGLMRQGWGKDTIKSGDRITADVSLAKNGAHIACVRVVTLADGRVPNGSYQGLGRPAFRQIDPFSK